jgi:hypothetical protein
MPDDIVIPANSIEVDSQGRVVITDDKASEAIKGVLGSLSAEDLKAHNFSASSNTACNILSYCA